MHFLTAERLSAYTSLRCGGQADNLVVVDNTTDLEHITFTNQQVIVLGGGTNSLISDHGLRGLTLLMRTAKIEREHNTIIADAGVDWDELVQFAIEQKLWGLELMSGIPGSVGGGVVGNIAAYGQAVSDTIAWVELFHPETRAFLTVPAADLTFAYRTTSLQTEDWTHHIVTRAAFTLSPKQQKTLRYQSALAIAEESGADLASLGDARTTIMEARRRADSLLTPASFNAGSFFKNPLVTPQQATHIASFDESGKTAEQIAAQNLVHSGDAQRISASLVLLAAGFQRGQTWGHVRLHPRHVLRLENIEGKATAQEIYTVAQEIMATVQQKLDIALTPEVKFLGQF